MGVLPAASDAGMVSHFIRHSGALAARLSPKQSERDVSPIHIFFALALSQQAPNNFMNVRTSLLWRLHAANKFQCRIAAPEFAMQIDNRTVRHPGCAFTSKCAHGTYQSRIIKMHECASVGIVCCKSPFLFADNQSGGQQGSINNSLFTVHNYINFGGKFSGLRKSGYNHIEAYIIWLFQRLYNLFKLC